MSVIYRSTVNGISVNCRWYIGELSVVYRWTVGGISVNCRSNISRVLIYQVSPMAFFLAKTSLITVIMRWGNMWQCEALFFYEANWRALGTRHMVTFFCQIVWSLAVKQNLSERKLNLLLLWSCSRRILKKDEWNDCSRGPEVQTCFKSEECTSFIIGLWPASSRRVLACVETTN